MFVLFGFSICIMIWNPTASASTIFLWNQTVSILQRVKPELLPQLWWWKCRKTPVASVSVAPNNFMRYVFSEAFLLLWYMRGIYVGQGFFSFCRFFLMIAVPSEKHWFDTLNIKAFANRAHTEVLLILRSWNTTWRDHLLRDEDNSVSKAAEGLTLSN